MRIISKGIPEPLLGTVLTSIQFVCFQCVRCSWVVREWVMLLFFCIFLYKALWSTAHGYYSTVAGHSVALKQFSATKCYVWSSLLCLNQWFESILSHAFTTKLETRISQSSTFKEFVAEEEAYLEWIELFFLAHVVDANKSSRYLVLSAQSHMDFSDVMLLPSPEGVKVRWSGEDAEVPLWATAISDCWRLQLLPRWERQSVTMLQNFDG